tara:strand:+ start:249 stop:551 length:303 start_codon:yes stop_codon:yes gene_type:complete
MGYKMKGSKFYGKGNSSPAKKDMTSEMVAAVKAKDEQDLKFKQKGWVGALQKAESAVRRPVKKAIDDVDTNLEGLEEEDNGEDNDENSIVNKKVDDNNKD